MGGEAREIELSPDADTGRQPLIDQSATSPVIYQQRHIAQSAPDTHVVSVRRSRFMRQHL
jgi:hypothetical protein